MPQRTGGELLAQALANEGVRHVFGLSCPEIDPLLAALEANGIRLVPIRHEAAAVHMTEGLYKTTGQVAVVLGNPGPGSANLLPGVIAARHEGVPVLVITSQHRSQIAYPSTPATFQGQDQLDLFRPAVKWGGPAFEWSRILELGMLGTGIPSAIGAKLGDPSREVVCVTGDGAAGFNAMELQSAAREGVKLTVVVLADGQWSMEIPNPTARWGRTFGTAMGAVDWAKVAEGLGCHGETVDSIADLAPALERARARPGPSLVRVHTSVEANLAVPPTVGGRFFEVYFGPAA